MASRSPQYHLPDDGRRLYQAHRVWAGLLLWSLASCAPSLDINAPAPSPQTKGPERLVLACAGPDLQSLPALQVRLDARCSRMIGDDLPFSTLWRQMEGPRVTLFSAISPLVDLLAPFDAATLIFSYEISEQDILRRDHAQMHIVDRTPQAAPIAQAGGDRRQDDGALLLNGSTSRSLEGLPLTYTWRQISGPSATLQGQGAQVHVDLGDAPGPWVFSLEVADDTGLSSEPDFVVVRRPHAEASSPPPVQFIAPLTAQPGELITLRYDPTTDELTNTTFRVMRGDSVSFSFSDGELIFTAPLRPQTLVIRGDRERQGVAAAAALAIIKVTAGIGNHAPIAFAGSDRRVRPGLRLVLDGGQSRDPDGDPLLSYRWQQSAGPRVALTCEEATCLLDTPDTPNRLAFSLIVFDGQAESQPDVIIIDVDAAAQNQAPIASAGGDRWALPGDSIYLDGSQSFDPDSGTLASFRWRQDPGDSVQVNALEPTRARLLVPTPTSPSLLHFELTVCDADGDCASDTAQVHVEDAGPYVDALLGDDSGDGTAMRPLKTVQRAMEVAQRFGLAQLRLAEGDYTPTGDLILGQALELRGGYQRDGDAYLSSSEGTSHLWISSSQGLQLTDGASLRQIDLQASAGLARVPTRRLLHMDSQTRLQQVRVGAPGPARQSISVEIGTGSQVLIEDSEIEAGAAEVRSIALLAQTNAELTLRRSRILIGSAPTTLGCQINDGRIDLDDVEIETGPREPVVGHSVTGLEALRSDVRLRASSVRLDRGLSGLSAQQATALLCQRCSLHLSSDSVLHGARSLANEGRSVGLSLRNPILAQLQGQIVGAGTSPTAHAIGLEIQDGVLNAQDLDVQAADNAQIAYAIAVILDSAEVQTQRLHVRATASQVAIGILLSGGRDMQLNLADTLVQANDAYGLVDGRNATLDEARPATSRTSLSLLGFFSVTGRVEATGVWLTGSHDLRITAPNLQVQGETRARGLRLDSIGSVDLRDSQLAVSASPLFGDASVIHCAPDPNQIASVTIRRSALQADASLSSGIDVTACNVSIDASVIKVDGPFLAQGLLAASQVWVNGVSLRVTGNSGAALRLQVGANATVINSVFETSPSLDTALDIRGEIDDLRTLHHVLFVPQGTPLLTLSDQILAANAIELDALRARFSSLWQGPATGLDASGHVLSASAAVVDRADPSSSTLLDLDGQTRPFGAGPDLGADEAF